jgi:hypothetical protein
MGYPRREEIGGVYYHVGTRGNNQRDIYTDDKSRVTTGAFRLTA